MAKEATPPYRSEVAKLTELPTEILHNIFRTLFEGATIDLKRPHDINHPILATLFPILSVNERLLAEGTSILLRDAVLEIQDLSHFPESGAALRLLQGVRNLSLQKYQLVTFGLSRRFPEHALRSSRRSFKGLRKIDISITSTLPDTEMTLCSRGPQPVFAMVDLAWKRPEDIEGFDLYLDYFDNELVNFIRRFQSKYEIALKMEFWVGDRLKCEATMSQGSVVHIVVENKGKWWNKPFWTSTLIRSWKYHIDRITE